MDINRSMLNCRVAREKITNGIWKSRNKSFRITTNIRCNFIIALWNSNNPISSNKFSSNRCSFVLKSLIVVNRLELTWHLLFNFVFDLITWRRRISNRKGKYILLLPNLKRNSFETFSRWQLNREAWKNPRKIFRIL